MCRRSVIDRIEDAIGHRRLVWFGTRGTDAQPLLQIRQFDGVFGLIAPLGVPSWSEDREAYLELLSGTRVDLNAYSIDADTSTHVRELHRRLRKTFAPGTLVIAYRPTAFLASAYYPRVEYTTYLGSFHGAQAAYEHKPWVETELSARGIATIPWKYFSEDDRTVMLEWMGGRACVLRANYSDGGVGLTLVGAGEELPATIPHYGGGFLAVAPLLDPNIPLNVSACVFRSGEVTVRHPSVQLIGISACTNRRFGYCGNDFGIAADVLGESGASELETLVRHSGKWLREQGYVGAFGVDALLYGGRICLTEINPRFQGSSSAAASVAARIGLSDIYLDHLCAVLGLPAPEQIPLWDQAVEQARTHFRLSQAVCYNVAAAKRMKADTIVPDVAYGEIKAMPDAGIVVQREAMLFKIFATESITATGFDIAPWIAADIQSLTSQLYDCAERVVPALSEA
ncbi:MAG: hypothetical protein QOE68_1914 [Thermoanaerobaculia bacterium]|nr:hypothetical protein [Thermoanaerobaculia bacterium]